MIQRLRRRFILMATGSAAAVLLVIVGAILIANYVEINRGADRILTVLAENGGGFPRPGKPEDKPDGLPPETRFETRFFTAEADQNGTVLSVDTRSVAALTDEQARACAAAVLARGAARGYRGSYRFLSVRTDAGTLIVFLDRGRITAFSPDGRSLSVTVLL